MAETGTSNLDDVAAQLQAKADEVLSSTGTDEEAAKAGGKREALRNMAKIVKEQAGKGVENSKDYLSKVVGQVSTYASDKSTTASSQYAEARERGLTQVNAAMETANTHYASAKETASTHVAGLQTKLNEAIDQGQAQGAAASGNTDRELPSDSEPLKFPFNFVAWLVSICHGKGFSGTTTTSSESTTATSKDFSVESLQNAAAALSESFVQEAHTVGDKIEAARSSGAEEAERAKKETHSATPAA